MMRWCVCVWGLGGGGGRFGGGVGGVRGGAGLPLVADHAEGARGHWQPWQPVGAHGQVPAGGAATVAIRLLCGSVAGSDCGLVVLLDTGAGGAHRAVEGGSRRGDQREGECTRARLEGSWCWVKLICDDLDGFRCAVSVTCFIR